MKLISEPTRLTILHLVWARECCAGEIAGQFKTTFGAVSQHVGALFRAGLLSRRRDGKRLYYRANRAALGPFAAALEAMWSERLTALRTLAEAAERESGPPRRPTSLSDA